MVAQGRDQHFTDSLHHQNAVQVRKLEFLLADAKAQGADCVITIGGIQSNHCRATAVAARYLGLDCHLILRTSRQVVGQTVGLVGNLLVERMAGAVVHKVSPTACHSMCKTAWCTSTGHGHMGSTR